ncbi:hypothetical protein L228DRAFT_283275 [Xylona heveae TC161]|uniref:Uncharacterized protein n=1 Tax=Xylona heveae (strain CBS 132557 / TC161) TaxID=1328760 RepID=A0A165GEC6_XYLHT|nr:hypothetical protein L228DRAFT_283275 [Xylona heveae TC161]KZF22089.1 hypothetical protein L228DRAFT_283275 [Xylona heveae TC161]
MSLSSVCDISRTRTISETINLDNAPLFQEDDQSFLLRKMGNQNCSVVDFFASRSIKDDLLCLDKWSVNQQLARRIPPLGPKFEFGFDAGLSKLPYSENTCLLIQKQNIYWSGDIPTTRANAFTEKHSSKHLPNSRYTSSPSCPSSQNPPQNRKARSVSNHGEGTARLKQPKASRRNSEISVNEKLSAAPKSLRSSSAQSLRKVKGILGLKTSPSTCTSPSSKRNSRCSSTWTDQDGVSTLATTISDAEYTPTKRSQSVRSHNHKDKFQHVPLPIPQRRGSLGQDCEHGLLNPGKYWHPVNARENPNSTLTRRRHSISTGYSTNFTHSLTPGSSSVKKSRDSFLVQKSNSVSTPRKTETRTLDTVARQSNSQTNTKSAVNNIKRIRASGEKSQSITSLTCSQGLRSSSTKNSHNNSPGTVAHKPLSPAQGVKLVRDPEKSQRKLLVELWFTTQALADGLDVSPELASSWCDALYYSRRRNLDLDPFGMTKFAPIQEALSCDITRTQWWKLPNPELVVANELQSIIPNMFESFWITDPNLEENAIRVASDDLLRSTQFCSGEGIFADDFAGVKEGCQLSTSYDADGRLMYSLLITTPLILQETAKTRYFLTTYINITKYIRKHVLDAILAHHAPDVSSKEAVVDYAATRTRETKDTLPRMLDRSHCPSSSSLLSLERPISLIDWLEFALEEAGDSQELERHLSGSSSLGSPRTSDFDSAQENENSRAKEKKGAERHDKSLPLPGEIIELSGFIKQLKALHRDYFILAPGRTSAFYEVYYVSPHLYETGECVDGLLEQTLPETRQQLKHAWAYLKHVSIQIKWGKRGVDKMLYCTPLYGPGFSCWICFLTDACIGDIWERPIS